MDRIESDLRRPILAVVYADGLAADQFLADLGYRLRTAAVAVAGLVQRNTFVRNPARCDMEVEELASATVLRLSEDRGPAARGCRLDRAALAQAAGLLMRALMAGPNLVIVNKFGKTEAAGGGLRDAIAAAAQLDVPTIVGVPFRSLDQWHEFAGDLADECPVDGERVQHWLAQRRIFADADRRKGTVAKDEARGR